MRRAGALTLVLTLVVVAAGAGWLAGQRIRSPAQVAAEAEPPPASRITVPVEMRTISSAIVTRADVGYAAPENVTLPRAPTLVGGAPIVTVPPELGAVLAEGDRALEVSNRPILVLQGDLPMFRTIRLGDEGVDVVQLKETLSRLGYDPGPLDGAYDAATAAAIEAWYESRGYDPVGPDEEEVSRLAEATDAVATATTEVAAARRALAQAEETLPRSAVLDMQSMVQQARWSLEDTTAAVAAANDEAAASVAMAELAIVDADIDRTTAQERLTEALAGIHPDTGAPPTSAELAELERAVVIANQARADAGEALAAAMGNRDEVAALGTRRMSEARSQLRSAQAAYAELTEPPDTTADEEALAAATARLGANEAELAALQARTGTAAVDSEILFVGSLPARIGAVDVGRGDSAIGTIMQLTSYRLVASFELRPVDARRVAPGSTVFLDDVSLAVEATGTVVAIARAPNTKNRIECEALVDGETAELDGLNLRVEIPVETTGGDVLAVPVAALSAGPDGRNRVQVENGDGTTSMVVVDAGLTAGGYVQITPVDGTLGTGDRVVVGLAGG